ncbi:MAG TPA: hypothetical protein VFF53_11935, partial [Geobacteraceae bacterium]|nr:hypothetical protein [Geobacteraceae bacterium]
YQPFEWGDNVVDAIRKICAMQPVPAKKSFGTRNISCNEYVDLDVTNDEPLYIFGPEQNVSLLNYKGIGIQIGTGYIIKYSPVMIKNVEYEATLQFNSVSEGHGAYLYDTKKDKLPWMSQKGSIIYLPVILTSLRLTPLYKEKAAGEFKAVIDEFKIKYGRSFVKEVGNDKYVFYRDGIWLHVYDDGDIFYDGETYLKNTLAMYDNYYFKHMESEGVH